MTDAPEDAGVIYDELLRHFDEFSEDMKLLLGLDLDLDLSQLANVAQSYDYDLGRYVNFHEVQIPDRARRGAYICK